MIETERQRGTEGVRGDRESQRESEREKESKRERKGERERGREKCVKAHSHAPTKRTHKTQTHTLCVSRPPTCC